jgi:hypothetical protein
VVHGILPMLPVGDGSRAEGSFIELLDTMATVPEVPESQAGTFAAMQESLTGP